MKTLESFKTMYTDAKWFHRFASESFKEITNSYKELKELRDFVEANAFGFGEREFLAMHKMIVDSFEKKELTMMEIGVFRGQIITCWGILERLCNKNITRIGVTPLDSSDGHWESDYQKDLQIISDKFNVEYPIIIKGSSTDPDIINKCKAFELDVLYIDGSHKKTDVISDIVNYTPLLRKGGILIIDDSANNLKGCYDGKFWGIQDVSDAVDSLLPPVTENKDFEYIGSIIHNRLWKRK